MANPLFNQLAGASTPSPQPQMTNMNEQIAQLKSNPAQMIRNAGYNVPDEIANDPQATVLHLIQSGQIGGPMMQRIQPMLNMLMGKR